MNFNDYKYKMELHAHTHPGSGCSSVSPERMVAVHKQIGCDAVVITNHFHLGHIDHYIEPTYFYECLNKDRKALVETYLAGYKKTYEIGKKEGLNVILGMEIRFPQDSNDYLVFGIDEDFVDKSIDYLDKSLEEFYKGMKNDKNVIIQAHPFRNGMRHMTSEFLDGIETFNLHPEHNSRVGVACEYARDNHFPLTTCGSDFHDEPSFGLALMKSKTLPEDSFELAEIIKSRDYLFDVSGTTVIPYGFKESL